MKKSNLILCAGLLTFCAVFLVYNHFGSQVLAANDPVIVDADKPLMNVAYVTSESNCLPDPNLVTNIYYAFGEVSPDFKSVVIENPDRFQQIVDLKKQNPDLKITLSIGGYKKEGFSEMCASKQNRKAFVADIKRIVKKYDLDGIDLDWEFPTTTLGGHTARPDDDINYGYLVKELRKALGKNKLITFYSNNGAGFINFEVMMPYVDYVMVSGYNLGFPPKHQSNLYTSDRFRGWSIDKSVQRHHSYGVPYEKMLLGIPFFARTTQLELKNGKHLNYFDRTLFGEYLDKYKTLWDDVAKAPYKVDENGEVVATFDTPESIALKADYVRQHGMSGGFYWHYCSDDSLKNMAKAMNQCFMK